MGKKLPIFADLRKRESELIEALPAQISPSWYIAKLYDKTFEAVYIHTLRKMSNVSKKALSEVLNITTKTLDTYSDHPEKIRIDTKEHVLMLMSLWKHGAEVFGSRDEFNEWLHEPNFYFDHKEPITFLNTNNGIRFIDNRLTAMEYGDNA